MAERIQVWSEVRDFRKRLEVFFFVKRADGGESVAEPLVFRDCTQQLVETPTIGDGREFLQACMDHAWELGMRPAGFKGATDEVAAIRAHLADMRALVFERVPPPGEIRNG